MGSERRIETTTRGRVRAFLESRLLIEFGDGVEDDTDLLGGGMLDSLGIVELVVFMESTFGVKLTPDDYTSGALTSVAGIVALLEKRAR